MNTILLQIQLSLKELDQLLKEFPQYLFLSLTPNTYKNLSPEQWAQVEILYGNRLTPEELALAPQLRWIHSTVPDLHRFCLNEIKEKGNVIITDTKGENAPQISEFVTGGLLAFAKNLFHWYDLKETPSTVWDSKWRDAMWTLKDRIFLQVGLGQIGTEIARRVQAMEMRVWGVQQERSFHPFCDKVIETKDLHSVLPAADVVCLTLPRGNAYNNWFQEEELKLMKEDSILIVIGSHLGIKAKDLAKVANAGKFRGILIDASYARPIPANSILWKIPNIIISPEVAPRPKSEAHESFRTFRYNLRQYMHNNFKDMRNISLQHPSL